MATVSVSVKVDKRELERLIRRSPADASATVKRQTGALRDDIARRMPKRTGQTARNTRAVMRGPYEGAVEIPEVPGRFLVEGTRAHAIVPRRGRALRFVAGGMVVFARRVWHPGTKPNRFAEDAARAAVSPAARAVAKIFGGR
jgi:hypothetical protein